MNMKKIFIIICVAILLLGSCHATDSTVKINGAKFEIPSKYKGGEFNGNEYKLDNMFSIRCIDKNIANAIGLWASESEFSEDLNINNHPVRHFCQYNKYVEGNHSHAYFLSGESVYEIAWTGKEINTDIEKLIKNTPKSEIDDDTFYDALDISLDIYKEQKKDKLNKEAEYNYLEAKYQTQSHQDTHDNTRFNQILYTYYLNK